MNDSAIRPTVIKLFKKVYGTIKMTAIAIKQEMTQTAIKHKEI
ncbi:hypothetical protein N9144_01910 [Flavobacteriaceae bacterium]|jgi:hypothetical protein|nr:hypothetical protein [Flavobacteriaceae bacterium]MDB4005493.1 hypothetical protein [Flavobacteriaceae bacterium]MDB4437918.1 hypothetical protein [Flavobacteriaceae bacterium]|tara:strand:- start:1913 stop:2041 length:129 start_codon:yes stop_codon:yes gene_type:complete